MGPGGADSQPPRLREDEALSSLLLPPLMRVCADGARQSPSRPRSAPASISTGGGGRSNNLPSPCWKEATSGPQPEREEAAAVSREAGRAEGNGRAGGTRILPAPRPRYRWSGAAGGSGERRTEMAAATWELAEEEEGQGFPSGPPALGGGGGDGGGGRLPRDAPPAPEGWASRGLGKGAFLGEELPSFHGRHLPLRETPGIPAHVAASGDQPPALREGEEKRVGAWEVSGLPGALPQPLSCPPGAVALPALPLGRRGALYLRVRMALFHYRLHPPTEALESRVSSHCMCTRSIGH